VKGEGGKEEGREGGSEGEYRSWQNAERRMRTKTETVGIEAEREAEREGWVRRNRGSVFRTLHAFRSLPGRRATVASVRRWSSNQTLTRSYIGSCKARNGMSLRRRPGGSGKEGGRGRKGEREGESAV